MKTCSLFLSTATAKYFLLALMLFFKTFPAHSQVKLDSTFSQDGLATNSIQNSLDARATSIAVQSDGKIIVAGQSFAQFSSNIALARYNTDGTLDATFNGDGKLNTEIGFYSIARDCIVQPDGKIVIAGFTDESDDEFLMVRYHTDGSPDNSFGENGVMTTQLGGYTSEANALVRQSDGKLIAAGYTRDTGDPDYDFAVVRVTSDGVLDNSFSGDGKFQLDVNGENDVAFAIAVQQDGKIVFGGSSLLAGNASALVRLLANGTPDPDFGSGGVVITDSYVSTSLLIQEDGKILSGGYSSGGQGSVPAIVRYLADGDLDLSFGNNGFAIPSLPSFSATASAIALQPDKKILLAGSIYTLSAPEACMLMRFDENGNVDNTFGDDGLFILPLSDDEPSNFMDAVLQSDYKIVAAGFKGTAADDQFAVARFINPVVEPICQYPEDRTASNITSTTATVNWTASSFASKYKVRYKPSGTSAWINVSTQNNSKNLSGLIINTKYVWEVRSICNTLSTGKSEWSPKEFFTTISTKLSHVEAIDLNVFPNPVVSSAIIQFSLENSSDLKIELMDLQGRKIRTITAEYYETGNHTITFSAVDILKGVYLLQLRTNSTVISQKIVVE
ncbi:MAG TPA: T9SS type A sorting domain-containing protein [Chitinophagales bacterium]|nr:T9SS type A sorting domain-containing protein [Chitinophagales bacterium]